MIVVEADNPLYKTAEPLPVYINGELHVTTGRVGESMSFGPQSAELIEALQKLSRS